MLSRAIVIYHMDMLKEYVVKLKETASIGMTGHLSAVIDLVDQIISFHRGPGSEPQIGEDHLEIGIGIFENRVKNSDSLTDGEKQHLQILTWTMMDYAKLSVDTSSGDFLHNIIDEPEGDSRAIKRTNPGRSGNPS